MTARRCSAFPLINWDIWSFKAEILDESGNATSADLGHTYRKLLCIAFDMAVLRAHLDDKFPRFVYHDGVFESLDDRKKKNLLSTIREYAEFGIQPVITLIDTPTCTNTCRRRWSDFQ